MELVCSDRLNKNDLDAIKNTYKSPEDITKDHVAALGWMIAKKKLKIKIAISIDEDGFPIDESQGMFHLKVGIMVDEENNMLSFRGSINETEYGWKRNIEEIKVFKN